MVTSPKSLAEVLVTKNYDFQKPAQVRHTIGRILGFGILLAEGEVHKVQRKNLLPSFAFRHIKDLYPLFWEKSCDGVRAMTRQILEDASKTPGTESTAVIEAGKQPHQSFGPFLLAVSGAKLLLRHLKQEFDS